jgi:PAS domain S-box-containing protein
MSDSSAEPGGLSHWVEELVHVMDRMNCGMIGRDPESQILFVNPRILRWTGWERSDLIGRPLRMLFPPEIQAQTRREVTATERGDMRARLSIMLRKDSTTFPILVIPQTFEDSAGKHAGIVSLVVDLGTIETAKHVGGTPPRTLTGRLEQISWELQSLSLAAAVSSETMPLSHPDLRELSSRESEILSLLASGDRSAAIAKQLHISPHTVRNHLKSIFKKLGVKNQSELIARVRSLGETPGPDFDRG